jgi:hypothetical protein
MLETLPNAFARIGFGKNPAAAGHDRIRRKHKGGFTVPSAGNGFRLGERKPQCMRARRLPLQGHFIDAGRTDGAGDDTNLCEQGPAAGTFASEDQKKSRLI